MPHGSVAGCGGALALESPVGPGGRLENVCIRRAETDSLVRDGGWSRGATSGVARGQRGEGGVVEYGRGALHRHSRVRDGARGGAGYKGVVEPYAGVARP